MAGRIRFTAPRVKKFTCPPDKPQAFLWDTKAPGLGLRVTLAGARAYVFQGRYMQKSIRVTIGAEKTWPIPKAQAKAVELQRLIDEGKDPREERAAKEAQDRARRIEEKAKAVTVGEAWGRYVEERKASWGRWHYEDHKQLAQAGGAPRKRRPGTVTKPGPLHGLMKLRLADLDAQKVEAWAAKESKSRPAKVRLSLRLLKAFLRWAAEDQELQAVVNHAAASTKRTREAAGSAKPRSDHLQKSQLETWFHHVRMLPNPVIAAYLQCLLLTGARPGEMARLRWQDLDFQWSGMTVGDKVEDTRPIPLTPYVRSLLESLPRRNKWVFSSPRSKSGHVEEVRIAHDRACAAAGLELTLHGLRRSFKSLTEWLEIPVGVVAQIMGHKPSATAEKHYTIRPLELLRLHHEKIEAWILEQAGIDFDPSAQVASLRLVK